MKKYTLQFGKDGDGMTRFLWKKARRISTALVLALTIIFSISCSNEDESPYDATTGDVVPCWPQGNYSGKVIEKPEFYIIEIISAPIEAPDSLWPCVGHQVLVEDNQHEFHIGETIVFEMKGTCYRPSSKLDMWYAAIEIKE